jgi:predicted RecB family nuclease
MENAHADWARSQSELYRSTEIKWLLGRIIPPECAVGLLTTEKLETAKWKLAVDFAATGEHLESRIHAVERIPSKGRGAPAQFIPIRFIARNKLTKDDKLLIAFDALALSEVTGGAISLGKIVHGDNHVTAKVKIPTLAQELGNLIEKAAILVSSNSPPDLILNPHCAECEFQAQCRRKAIEKDDLSLLTNMTEKERKKLNSKGIFTVTQLSFTFRPRRRPKRLRNKQEKYHHALKALAIHRKQIHLVGTPELQIEGTRVYLDVEALPDEDFYYLIGVRINTANSVVERSLWADHVAEERKIWCDFIDMLAGLENPILIHYGRFETMFLKQMSKRYGVPLEGSAAAKVVKSALNLNSFLFAQVYFPTYSNTLKDIGTWLGCKWGGPIHSGAESIIWRTNWEQSRDPSVKQSLITYNLEDCEALEVLTNTLLRICSQGSNLDGGVPPGIALAQSLISRDRMWREFSSPVTGFEFINRAARWDYQRDRIYVRTDTLLKSVTSSRTIRTKNATLTTIQINKDVNCTDIGACPFCGKKPDKVFRKRQRVLWDVRFSRFGVRRWVVRFHFRFYWCASCDMRFGVPAEFWPKSIYGRNLVALIVYETIGLCVRQMTVGERINRLFGLELASSTVYDLKTSAAEYYAETRERILAQIIKGKLVHADETPIALKDRQGYVWVFATFHEVVYFYTETREGELVRERLRGFEGVLVTDFYTAYDSLPCPQQKCLLHLMRDLNEAVLDYPYDEELKQIATSFAELLKSIVQTIDGWGLKRRFLNKHRADVDRFYRQMSKATYRSEGALKFKERFEKNSDKLFTFLSYDGVPWNNNNAEYAVKAFARLRRNIIGLSSAKGIEADLILLSVCQTCKYSGVDFLDFLRSGEKDINAFAKTASLAAFFDGSQWIMKYAARVGKLHPRLASEPPNRWCSLGVQEREMIEAALRKSKGRVSGPSGAAVKLGIPGTTLESKIRSLDIDKSRFRTADGA